MTSPQPPQRYCPPTRLAELWPMPAGKVVAGGWDLDQQRPAVYLLTDFDGPSQYLLALGEWEWPPVGAEHVLTWQGILPLPVIGGVSTNAVSFHLWRVPAPTPKEKS